MTNRRSNKGPAAGASVEHQDISTHDVSPQSHPLGSAVVETPATLRNCFAGAVLTVDRRQRLAAATPAAESLLSLGRGQATLPAWLRKIVQCCFDTGEPLLTQTIAPAAKKGPHRSLAVSAVPMRRGRVTEVVVVLHDLSPLRLIEQHLRRLDRLASMGTLSASMAHEIKNALVAVKTFVDLLLDRNRDSELTETVQREMLRIEAIVRQMLRCAAPPRPAYSAVRLHDVLEQSLRMVQRQLDGKLITLSRSFRAAPDYIQGDDYQLEQAFVNLLLNAVEAMGPNGSLQVATELLPAPVHAQNQASPLVRVTISDTGVGVAPENMIRLFEPFFTTKHDGTGLGLPITQRIVKEHHGDITVQSEPNKGTTFNIFFPAKPQ
jgi:signal transduction histidine kinase